MNWVNFTDAARMARELARRIPNEYDLIVGIPRSGMWLASYLACLFGLPLATPDGTAWRSRLMRGREFHVRRPLLVDDTVSLGGAMREAQGGLELPCATACLIVQPGSEHLVDYYHSVIPHPRLFEWNLAHAKKGRVAFDIDGVLCPNPPSYTPEYLASADYASWLSRARPLLLPAYDIDLIVSGRTEPHRAATEAWLAEHGVRYGALSLVPEEHERSAAYHARHKAAACEDHGIAYLVESDTVQAELVAELAEIPVIATDTMTMYGGKP